jgi:hypothetical protein
MNGTKQMFWERLYTSIMVDHGLQHQIIGKTIEQMKAECFTIIKNEIDIVIGDLSFSSEEYLKKRRIKILNSRLIFLFFCSYSIFLSLIWQEFQQSSPEIRPDRPLRS